MWREFAGGTKTYHTDADGKYVFDDLRSTINVMGETYLAGYKLYINTIPDGYNADAYAGKDAKRINIRDTKHEMNGFIVLGEVSDDKTGQFNTINGYDIIKGLGTIDLNVYLNKNPINKPEEPEKPAPSEDVPYKKDENVYSPQTSDDLAGVLFTMKILCAASLMILILFGRKRKEEKE